MEHTANRLWVMVIISFQFLVTSGFIDTEETLLLANEISRQLHTTLENNLDTPRLEILYENMECSRPRQANPQHRLNDMVSAVESRLNDTMAALLGAKLAVESLHDVGTPVDTPDCCSVSSESQAQYSPRFRTMLNASIGCQTRNVKDSRDIQRRVRLLETFKRNLARFPITTWQYHGTSRGHYLQFPANARVCNGSASFDPRFKSWYVEAASRMRTNIVLVIDRSSSMRSENRMALARQAAVTVLNTLGPNDKVGVLAFSHDVTKPSGCFGNVVAQAFPENLKQIRTWVEALYPSGATMYGPAFTSAFQMLAGATQAKNNSMTEEAENLILFLTDGDPFDSRPDVTIFDAIRNGQDRLTRRARINVYGLGGSLNNQNLVRLQRITSENSGTFTQILDQDSSNLRAIMGQYYIAMVGPVRDRPAISVPHLNRDSGLVVTLSVACRRGNGNVTGVVAVDVWLDELMKELVQFSARGASYAILIDNKGRTILHPSVPKPIDHVTPPTFQPLTLHEPRLTSETLRDIMSGQAGSARIEISIPLSRGDPLTDGVQSVIMNATFSWRPVRGGAYVVILVTSHMDVDHINITSKSIDGLADIRSHYHRLDLTWNQATLHLPPVCNMDGHLISPLASTIKVAPEAFSDSARFIYTPETADEVAYIQRFFNDQRVTYSDLGEQARVNVILTAQLEQQWNASQHRQPDTVQWRYIGTEGGVFRVFPGLRMNKTYSHRRQPWYRRAVHNAGRLTVTQATQNTSWTYPGAATISLTKAFNSRRCARSGVTPIAGVAGLDMDTAVFQELLTDASDACNPNFYDCYMMDESGYLVISIKETPAVFSRRHVTEAFPWLAAIMSTRGLLKPSWCNNLEYHRMQLFYTLHLPLNSTWSTPDAEPCRQFSLAPVPSTNIHLLILRTRSGVVCDETQNTSCKCQPTCPTCTTGYVPPCQCPCSCRMIYDECTNSVTGLWTETLCPVTLRPSFDIPVGEMTNQDALSSVPLCPKPCNTLTSEIECNTTTSCHWCRFSAIPTCSSVCRTGERLSLTIPFPCNNFLDLSLLQQSEVKEAFRNVLQQKIQQLKPRALGSMAVNAAGIVLTMYGTTDGLPVAWYGARIQSLIESSELPVGPSTSVQRTYTAASSKQHTNLNVQLFLPISLSQQLASLKENQQRELANQLKASINVLLGDSPSSQLRHVRFHQDSISFYLTNQGDTTTDPIDTMDNALRHAVATHQLRLLMPTLRGDTMQGGTWVHVQNISTNATFDFICHPHVTPEIMATVLPTSSHPTENPSDNTSLTHPSPHEPIAKEGLVPTHVFILVVTLLASIALCPLILCFAYRRRRRKAQRLAPDTQTEVEDDFPSDNSTMAGKEFPTPYVDNTRSLVDGRGTTRGDGCGTSTRVVGRGPPYADDNLNKQSALNTIAVQPMWCAEPSVNGRGYGDRTTGRDIPDHTDEPGKADSSYPGKYCRKNNTWKIKVLAATRLSENRTEKASRGSDINSSDGSKLNESYDQSFDYTEGQQAPLAPYEWKHSSNTEHNNNKSPMPRTSLHYPSGDNTQHNKSAPMPLTSLHYPSGDNSTESSLYTK